jgi:adenylate cyclase
MSNIRSVIDWLEDGARSAARAEDVLAELCARLVDTGMPLWRVAVFVRTLHPDIMGRRFLWQPGMEVKASNASYEMMETAEFLDSPVVAVYRTGQPLRRHLDDPNCPDDFPIVHDLRAEGATDYAAFPLFFTDGSVHVATWTTKQKGGFTAQEFADLESVIAPLARVAEVRALRRTAQNLLDTYIGNQAGERIMAGKIRRGDVEAIRAAIWLSDMRGFTTLSERLPPKELIDLLNRYFDAQVPAIHEGGGEVLKFMGDGLLAIFPIGNDGDAAAVCRRALACALTVRDRVAELPRNAEDADGTRFGLALHAGEVMYGNIGGGNRLDFTCIGPAVNLAARLEKVAAKLGETIVASAAFARHFPGELVRRGEFPVAGFAAPQTVYGFPQ